MKDDYLWDPSGTPDADIQRLERLLGRLRTTRPAPPISDTVRRTNTVRLKADSTYDADTTYDKATTPVGWRTVRFLAPSLAAAAAIIVMVALTWKSTGTGASWSVASLSGTPRIGAGTLTGEGRLAVGQTLVTDATSQARLHVSTIGEVTVDPDTRVRLVETRDGRHRLALDPGTPRYDDGAEALLNALDELDYGGDTARRAAALRFVLDHPDTSAVTLWHLVPRVGEADRGAVVDALADQLAMPRGVTREAILRLDRAALDAWWNELGLGDEIGR